MIYKCKSNAKINISLKIVGMKNGYHLLNSVFIPIDLCDDMEFSDSDTDEIIGFDFPKEDNLIYKAIELIRKKYNINKCVSVKVKKNIPSKAGLGGGSSNCAFTLKALNTLWHLKLSTEALMKLACELGSDVPFFLLNTPSYVTGRGEIIEPIEFNPIEGIIIFDNAYFSTPTVYSNFDKMNESYSKDYPIFNGKIDYVNDLEKAIANMEGYDIVQEGLKDFKKTNASFYMLSGSGGSVFGIYNKEDLDKAYNTLKEKHKFVYRFKSI